MNGETLLYQETLSEWMDETCLNEYAASGTIGHIDTPLLLFGVTFAYSCPLLILFPANEMMLYKTF